MHRNKYLIAAGVCSAVAALIHLVSPVFGGDWYRFFGAGEQIAQMAEAGHWYPTVVAFGIAAVLALWSLYAFSGAGLIRRLPLSRLALCLIAAVFLGRGISFVVLMPMFPGNSLTFWLVSSAICFGIGVLYAVGTYQRWPDLSRKYG